MGHPPGDWMVEVQLVEDDGSPDAPSGPLPGSEAGGGMPGEPARDGDHREALPPAARRRRGRRLGWLLAAGGVAVLVVAVNIFLVRHPPDAPLPGAVASLDEPVRERWQMRAVTDLAVADGTVVVETEAGGRMLRGLDTDGEEIWSQPLGQEGAADICGNAVTTDPGTAWCWRSRRGVVDADTGETVISPAALVGLRTQDGAVAVTRVMDVPSAGYASLGPDLVMGARADMHLSVSRIDPNAWYAHWSTRMELLPRTYDGTYDAWIEVTDGLVVVHGPTVMVLDADDGRVLGRWDPVEDPDELALEGAVVVTTPNGFAVWSEMVDGVRSPRGTWYDAEGRAVAEFEGQLAEPAVSDASAPTVLLVRDGTRLAAVDTSSGAELWSSEIGEGQVLVRKTGRVVVGHEDEVVGIDLISGMREWSTTVAGLRPDIGWVTDGRSVAVASFAQGRWQVHAVALGTGELMWFADLPGAPVINELFIVGGPPRLFEVGGHTVVTSDRSTTWLG